MIDFHSHLLPKMDDGSKSAEESLEMLKMSAKQGVKKIVATPHFHANHWSVESFIKHRQESYLKLKDYLTSDLPEIILGAEVRYYEGISRLDNLKQLCIQNTDLLLLEMPVDKWSSFAIKELNDLSCRSDIVLVLAHVDRYFGFQSAGTFQMLSHKGILMQINAESFDGFFRRRKALSMLENRIVQFVGSDCHDLNNRPPNMGKAFETIEKKLGKSFVRELTVFQNSVFFR